jgi:hypothetical protein
MPLDRESIRHLDEVNPGDRVEIVYGQNGCLSLIGNFVDITDKHHVFPRRIRIASQYIGLDGEEFTANSCVPHRHLHQFRVLQ